MQGNIEELTGLEKGIQLLIQERGESYANHLSSILFTNFEKKRIDKWIDRQAKLSVEDYVQVVAKKYDEIGSYVSRIQIEKSEEEWTDLYLKLRKWAFNFFIKHGLPYGDSTSELADGCAADAAMKILTAWFPFDVDFDPWAHLLLLNVCRHEVRSYSRQSQVPDSAKVDLNDELDKTDVSFSPDGRNDYDMRHTLIDAINQISTESWRQVLMLRYYHGLTQAEIAEELNKTPSAVYNLLFKANKALRKVWNSEERDST